MKRKLQVVGIVLAVIVVAIVALPFGLDVNSFRPKLESELSTALGRPVTVGKLGLSLMAGTVTAQDLSIGDDPAFSQDPFVRAKSLKVGVEIFPLIFSKSLRITELTLQAPEITLLRSETGTWNYSSLGSSNSTTTTTAQNWGGTNTSTSTAPASTPNLSVKKIDIKDGRISVGHGGLSQPHIYTDVNVSVSNFSFSSQFPFKMSAAMPNSGSLKVDGKAGPINLGDTSLTPFETQINVKGLDLAASGMGEVSPGISGVADFDGSVNSDGQVVRTTGMLQATKLKLVQSGSPAGRAVQLKYTLEHQLHDQSGTITQGEIAMGKAVAQLTGTYQKQGETTLLGMKINGQGMPVDDLEAMLPALGVVLPSGSRLSGGTLSANLAINGPADNPVITGPIRLSNSRLAGFDLGSKLSAISKLSGSPSGTDTSIENLSTDLRMAPDGVHTQKVNLTIPALGVLTGDGMIAPGGTLNYKMLANLNGALTTTVTKLAGLGSQGESVPFYITGTTSDPSFSADMKGMLTGQIGNQVGSVLKSKLQGKDSKAVTTSKKESIINKFTGFFHRKKK